MRAWFNRYLASGDLFVWGSGAGLAISLLMVVGLLLLIMSMGSDISGRRTSLNSRSVMGPTLLDNWPAAKPFLHQARQIPNPGHASG